MTVTLLVTLTTLLLENKNLLALASVVENSCCNLSTVHIWCTNLDSLTLCYEEYLVELYCCTLLSREAVDEDFHASLYFELLACNVYNCVHKKLMNIKVLDCKRQLHAALCSGLTIFKIILYYITARPEAASAERR